MSRDMTRHIGAGLCGLSLPIQGRLASLAAVPAAGARFARVLAGDATRRRPGMKRTWTSLRGAYEPLRY
jgi:hypothetical protein